MPNATNGQGFRSLRLGLGCTYKKGGIDSSKVLQGQSANSSRGIGGEVRTDNRHSRAPCSEPIVGRNGSYSGGVEVSNSIGQGGRTSSGIVDRYAGTSWRSTRRKGESDGGGTNYGKGADALAIESDRGVARNEVGSGEGDGASSSGKSFVGRDIGQGWWVAIGKATYRSDRASRGGHNNVFGAGSVSWSVEGDKVAGGIYIGTTNGLRIAGVENLNCG